MLLEAAQQAAAAKFAATRQRKRLAAAAEAARRAKKENAAVLASYKAGDLCAAAKAGDSALMLLLLGAGVDANAAAERIGVSKSGNTTDFSPLMLVIEWGQVEAVPVLLDAGADVNAASKRGFTALILAANNGFPTVCTALAAAGANLEAATQWSTALILAAQNVTRAPAAEWDPKALAVTKALLAKGANVNAKNNTSHSALFWAKRESLTRTAAALRWEQEKRRLRVEEQERRAEVAKLEGHGGEVWSVAWSGEGEGARLASGGRDGTVRVWDVVYGGGRRARRQGLQQRLERVPVPRGGGDHADALWRATAVHGADGRHHADGAGRQVSRRDRARASQVQADVANAVQHGSDIAVKRYLFARPGAHGLHLRHGQAPVEEPDVLDEVRLVVRLRADRDVRLHDPAQRHLRSELLMDEQLLHWGLLKELAQQGS